MANNSTDSANSRFPVAQAVTIAVMLLFTIIITWILLAGGMPPIQGYLWMGICCLFPIGWFCYGYLRSTDNLQSSGLLMTIIGWVLVAIGFLVHYKALLEAGPGLRLQDVSFTSLTILLLLGLLVLVAGGMISWQAMPRPQQPDANSL